MTLRGTDYDLSVYTQTKSENRQINFTLGVVGVR